MPAPAPKLAEMLRASEPLPVNGRLAVTFVRVAPTRFERLVRLRFAPPESCVVPARLWRLRNELAVDDKFVARGVVLDARGAMLDVRGVVFDARGVVFDARGAVRLPSVVAPVRARFRVLLPPAPLKDRGAELALAPKFRLMNEGVPAPEKLRTAADAGLLSAGRLPPSA